MTSDLVLAQITPKSKPSSDLEKEVREKVAKAGSKFMRLIWTDYSALVRARVVGLGRFFDSVTPKGTPVFGGAMALPIMYDSVPAELGDAGVSGGVVMKPDFKSSKPCPWYPQHYMTMGNLFIPDGKGGHIPWSLCPRGFLQKQLDRMKAQYGYDIVAGVENEFILYKSVDEKGNVTPVNIANYSETAGLRGNMAGLMDEIVEGIMEGNIPMGQYHTECADGQYEITTAPMEAMELADATIYIREVIHGVCAKHGVQATFSPKVFADQAGSASHIHFSFRDANGKNVYPDPKEKYGISKHGQQFMAGILDALPSLIAITLPSAASYKRVVPSAWAGVYTAWGMENKGADLCSLAPKIPSLMRLPLLKSRTAETPVRVTEDTYGVVNNVEVKAVDGTANIYLALGAIIAAGLDGMERGLELPTNTQCDPFVLSEEEKKARRIVPLPNTFATSIATFKANPLWKKVMGEEMYNMFIAARENEMEYFSKASDEQLRFLHVTRIVAPSSSSQHNPTITPEHSNEEKVESLDCNANVIDLTADDDDGDGDGCGIEQSADQWPLTDLSEDTQVLSENSDATNMLDLSDDGETYCPTPRPLGGTPAPMTQPPPQQHSPQRCSSPDSVASIIVISSDSEPDTDLAPGAAESSETTDPPHSHTSNDEIFSMVFGLGDNEEEQEPSFDIDTGLVVDEVCSEICDNRGLQFPAHLAEDLPLVDAREPHDSLPQESSRIEPPVTPSGPGTSERRPQKRRRSRSKSRSLSPNLSRARQRIGIGIGTAIRLGLDIGVNALTHFDQIDGGTPDLDQRPMDSAFIDVPSCLTCGDNSPDRVSSPPSTVASPSLSPRSLSSSPSFVSVECYSNVPLNDAEFYLDTATGRLHHGAAGMPEGFFPEPSSITIPPSSADPVARSDSTLHSLDSPVVGRSTGPVADAAENSTANSKTETWFLEGSVQPTGLPGLTSGNHAWWIVVPRLLRTHPSHVSEAKMAGSIVTLARANGGEKTFACSTVHPTTQGLKRNLVELDYQKGVVRNYSGHTYKFGAPAVHPPAANAGEYVQTVSDISVVESDHSACLVSAGYDRKVRAWDVKTGRAIAYYPHPRNLTLLATGKDNRGAPVVVSGDSAGNLRFAKLHSEDPSGTARVDSQYHSWIVQDLPRQSLSEVTGIVMGHGPSVNLVFATFGSDSMAKKPVLSCYDLCSPSSKPSTFQDVARASTSAAALSPSGSILAIGVCPISGESNEDKALRLYDVRGSRRGMNLAAKVKTGQEDCHFISFGSDRLVVAGDTALFGKVYDLRFFKEPMFTISHVPFEGDDWEDLCCLEFGGWTSGGLLVTGGAATVKFWDFNRADPCVLTLGEDERGTALIDGSISSLVISQGAGSGIGRACAVDLARRGARVVVADLDPNGGQETVKLIEAAVRETLETHPTSPALFVRADCSVDDDLVALVQRAKDYARIENDSGFVSVVVNNAGLQHVSPLPVFPVSKWNLLLSIMLTAPFRLTQLLLPDMYDNDWGRIVNVGSIHSVIASEGKAAYIAAKHGLVGLTKTTALEAASHSSNVTCNIICPSYVSTPLVASQIATQSTLHNLPAEKVISDIMCAPMPQKRLLDTGEVAALVGFLCDDAARGLNGSVLGQDGGWTAR
ncbi:hypothetical protein HDU93_005880 [Gonapodya sp. JEL0774]|nr:hypothetical protein HDU93_005880 [Gonapodya sp. JEL0774]